MIFDCAYVTELVDKWKISQDPKLLEVILEQTGSLIEAIVSGYDSLYREDLIQEASLRIQYALPYFDKRIANLHTYFTTVIKNICLSYLHKQNQYIVEYPIDLFESSIIFVQDKQGGYTDILEDLIVRNRQRFPSIPTEAIDESSELICDAMAAGINKRAVIKKLATLSAIDKKVASTLYISSLMYLRCKYYDVAKPKVTYDEFSIYTDMELLFGKDVSDSISIILSGLSVQFP